MYTIGTLPQGFDVGHSPMIEFLKLCACLVIIKGRHALRLGTCNYSNTRTSVGFKLAVRGDSGAGGLVAPLPCTACFGKLVMLFGCSLPQQAYMGLVHLYSYYSLA